MSGAPSGGHIRKCRNYVQAKRKPLCLLIKVGRLKAEIHRITAHA